MEKVRVLKHETVAGRGPCWIWKGAQRTNGYGHLQVAPKKWRAAHLYSWEHANGPIAPGLVLMHACDTELCVNPGHLDPGTQEQNRADRDAKGRLKGGPKLTERRVRHLRKRHASGESIRALAARFGIRFQTVYRAIKGQTWSEA